MRGVNSIFVQFDVEDFPLADTDSGVTTLMCLVAVVATEILHCAIIGDGYFIYG